MKSTSKDSAQLIEKSMKRVTGAFDKKSVYRRLPIPRSTNFLRGHIAEKLQTIVIFADLVGSTKMSEALSTEQLCITVRTFCQEMSYVIEEHGGRVLKFVGDAVIGYFIIEKSTSDTAKRSVDCAKDMIKIINQSINPISKKSNFPLLSVKIGIDYGQCNVVLYSANKQRAHVDLIGHVLNHTSKMQNIANPNQIIIGDNLYEKLPKKTKNLFKKISSGSSKLSHIHSNKKYEIYHHNPVN